MYTPWSPLPRASIAILYGMMYFVMGTAGGKNLVSYDAGIPSSIHVMNALAGVACSATVYNALEHPVKRPAYPRVIYPLAVLGGLSGLNFYTGGRFGALLLGLPKSVAEAVAAISLALRFYICGRSTLSCCDTVPKWIHAVKGWNRPEILRMSAALSVGVSASLFNTDPLLSALQNMGMGSYLLMAVLATAGLPFYAIWMNAGIQKLTNGFEKEGEIIHPDRFTFLAVPLCLLLFTLPVLGSANSPNGEAFTSWAGVHAAFALKMVFLLLFSTVSPVLGVEALLKSGFDGIKKIKGCFCFKPATEGLTATPLPSINLEMLEIKPV